MTLRSTSVALAASLLAFSLATTGCGSGESDDPDCESSADCELGEICTNNACGTADANGDDADAGGEDADTDDTGGDDADTGGDDTGIDVAPDADAGSEDTDAGGEDTDTGDEDTTDADEDTDAEPDGSTFPTLADYRACDTDTDCPNGLGNCITRIPFNRPDPVLGTHVTIADIDPDWPAAGVCSLACTGSSNTCDTLALRDGAGRPVPFTCQVLIEGESPYPVAAPPFPFADTLSPELLEAGVPFGAICRPPFGLDDANSDNFCFGCDGNDTCGTGDVCWDFATQRTADLGGSCLMACDEANACPFGFSCDELSQDDGDPDGLTVLGTFCAPLAQTCSDCRDLDNDGRGVGLCGSGADLVSAVDCDDLDGNAYYSTRDPDHPFPELCGEFDNNCNGLSDASEQVGAGVYPEEHCTACGDVCSGVEPNATRQCQTSVDTAQPFCAVVCDDPTAFADCTAEPGCETEVSDPTRLFYRDFDGDGAGDPDDVVFACELGEAPDGYVANSADCNDEAPAAFGAFGDTVAGAEVCDGLDNDCDGGVDTGILEVGDSCTSDAVGVCAPGTFVCGGTEGLLCVSTIAPNTQAEICDGLDNDCDGEQDEAADITEIGTDCAADALGICAFGTTVCQGATGLVCEAALPEGGIDWPDDDAIDSNCDGIDGTIANAVFVSPNGLDADDGTQTRPVRTLARASELVGGTRTQVLLDSGASAGVYSTSSTTRLGFPGNYYGGFARGSDNTWTRNFERARLVATMPQSERLALGVQFVGAALPFAVEWLDIEVNTLGNTGQNAIAATCLQCGSTTFRHVGFIAGDGAPGRAGVTGDAGVSGFEGLMAGVLGNVRAAAAPPADPCFGTPSTRGEAGGGGAGGATQAAPNPIDPILRQGDAGLDGAGDVALRGLGGSFVFGDQDGNDGANAGEVITQPRAANGGANAIAPDPAEGAYNTQFGWVRPDGSLGPLGDPGAGGGGGSGGGANFRSAGQYLGGIGGASGGTAGCGGAGGSAGGAGGSSIALVLTQSNGVVFEDVQLVSGAGGAGGRGGSGGVGGAGAAGGASGAEPSVLEGRTLNGAGGASSGGGGGGGGGGGAGGSSYALLRDAATGTSGLVLTTGSAGAGGLGGTGGTGGQHGDLTDGAASVRGPDGRPGAPGEALQQRVY